MVFKTARLSVRPLIVNDLPCYDEMQGDASVMRYVGGKALTLEENRKDLERVIELYHKPNNAFWVWAIVDTSREFVGTCAIIKNDEQEWEVGYRLLQKFWGNGFGSEVAQGLIEHAFKSMHIPTLHAYVNRENESSVRILERFFQFEKEYWNAADNCWDRKYSLRNPHR